MSNVKIIKLPARSGTLEYSQEDQDAVLRLLGEVDLGEGVAIDAAQETENKARVRARVMVKCLESVIKDDADWDGYSFRVHTVKTGDAQFVPALSLKTVKAPDNGEGGTPAETPTETPAKATKAK